MKRKYKHIKTGAIIYSPFKIVGKNWVEVTENEVTENEVVETVDEKAPETVEENEQETAQEEKDDNIDGITKKEIMQELDAMGIKYNPRATKKELYDLMMQGR